MVWVNYMEIRSREEGNGGGGEKEMHLKETGVYFGHCTLLHKTVTLPVNSHSITTSPLGIRSIKSRRRKTAIYHQ